MRNILPSKDKYAPLTSPSFLSLAPMFACMLATLLTLTQTAKAQSYSDWAAPFNLGANVNSSASDQQPAVSPDGLSLYFTSNRSGGLGGFDLYVSHRGSISDAWGSPVNLGPALNTSSDEGNAAFSSDGRLLFFQSKRPGGIGAIDLWFSRRNNAQDDFQWQPPVNLGPQVNSTADDTGPAYFEDEARFSRQLYFGSTRTGGPGGADIYVSEHMFDDSFTAPALVPGLNSPLNDNDASIRRGGLEIIFQSNRSGSNAGTSDLWVATRPSALAIWSAPVNLSAAINTASADQNAYLSSDGALLFFSSDRPGGSGATDLYFSTRVKLCSNGDMYGASPYNALITVNQSDGTGTFIGNPNGIGLSGLAFDSTGRLFASTNRGASSLVQVNPDTGAIITTVGTINDGGPPMSIGDLTFQPGTDVLFGIRSNADGTQSGGKLYTINVATGAAKLIGDTGAGAGGGIAFAPDGTLYQASYNSPSSFLSLNTIDPSDAHRIRTVRLTSYYDGLGIRPADGVLFATLGGGDSVYNINVATGTESYLGSTGFGASDLDFRRNCGANRVDDVQFFISQHYRDFLGRDPDPEGLAFWTNEITLCGTDPSCLEFKRVNVSAAFFLSIEFQQTGYLLYRTYKTAYGNLPNAPVPVKFSEFLPDTKEIGKDVIVNQAGWEQLLESNTQRFFSEFVQRSRFTGAFAAELTPDQYVNQLFLNAGISPSATDRKAAVDEFADAADTSDIAARARALRRVAENSELIKGEFNRAFVLMQYFGYLRRSPNEAPEPDLNFDGFNFWLTKLNQFDGDYVKADMVKSFTVSAEYRQRFQQ